MGSLGLLSDASTCRRLQWTPRGESSKVFLNDKSIGHCKRNTQTRFQNFNFFYKLVLM